MSADFDFGDLALPDSNDLTAPVLGAQDTSLTDGDWRANNPMVNDTGESPDTALTPMPDPPQSLYPRSQPMGSGHPQLRRPGRSELQGGSVCAKHRHAAR